MPLHILIVASAKRNLGDKNGAIADYTKSIEVNPQDADAYSSIVVSC
jgi:hypothetical protein